MNRLTYWIKADTQYRVHSPFVFDLYRKVLFAPLGHDVEPRLLTRYDGSSRFRQTCFKLCDHYRADLVRQEHGEALLHGEAAGGDILVVDHPHRNADAERNWHRMMDNPAFRVAVDIYDIGVLFANPHLHRQRFLLR